MDLPAQHRALNDEIQAAINRILERSDFILGNDVSLFEAEFAAFCEAKHAISVDSGTSALELLLRAYDIGPGDEVITAANTFIATVLAISYVGATPVLVDIDPNTYTMDCNGKLREAITSRTKAIIPVHLYGQPADMDPILAVAKQHGLIVIEDACQAHGARYKGKRAGSLAHGAAFSFYPAKNLGACGDGGMIVTNDDAVADRIHMLRNYGQREKYYHALKGYNRRLDTMQAAILRVKLKHLDEWNELRRKHARAYTKLLGGNGIVLPPAANYAEPVWHLYVIRAHHRDEMREFLAKRRISTVLHYPVPINLQEAYQDLDRPRGSYPITERYADEILSLPMFPELTDEMIEYVVHSIKEFSSMHN